MKVFVAGATGVIGHRAVAQLVGAGHEVTGLARSDQKADQVRQAGAQAAAVDLFEPTGLTEAVARHDAVVNLATHIPRTSKAALPGAWNDNDRIRSVGSANLVDAALATGASVYVQESIAFVYEDRGDEWIDESTPVTLVPYVQSVTDSLANTDRFTAGGGRGVFLRFGMFYSPESHHTQDLFRWARRGIAADPSKPEAYKSLIHADDAAAAVVAALSAPAGIYNVCENDPVTAGEQAAVVAVLVGRRKLRRVAAGLSWVGGSKVELLKRSQRISNRRFRETTGWTPHFESVRDGFPAVHRALEAMEVGS